MPKLTPESPELVAAIARAGLVYVPTDLGQRLVERLQERLEGESIGTLAGLEIRTAEVIPDGHLVLTDRTGNVQAVVRMEEDLDPEQAQPRGGL